MEHGAWLVCPKLPHRFFSIPFPRFVDIVLADRKGFLEKFDDPGIGHGLDRAVDGLGNVLVDPSVIATVFAAGVEDTAEGHSFFIKSFVGLPGLQFEFADLELPAGIGHQVEIPLGRIDAIELLGREDEVFLQFNSGLRSCVAQVRLDPFDGFKPAFFVVGVGVLAVGIGQFAPQRRRLVQVIF